MASIPNNIVAKDSGGNIKKVDLDSLLQNYVKNDDIQNILSANWPACIKSANLSFIGMSDAEVELDSPYVVEAINLSTMAYGAPESIYSKRFSVEQRFIVKSTDAYKFSVVERSVPFGVCSTKNCFLVLSLEGYESIGVNTTIDEDECKELGTHGGNPIVLNWKDVDLAEGGTFKFSFKDSARPIGIFGELKLSRRIENVGNIHKYNVELNFVVCGSAAWTRMVDGNQLILTTINTGDELSESAADLSSLAYPRLASVEVGGKNEERFSTTAPTKISFEEGTGIAIAISSTDEGNVSIDEKAISISMDMDSIIGDGLVHENGKISVPTFTPANGADDAVKGLVPSASSSQFNNVLTVSGWKTLEEIGLNAALRPFVGASPEEDGEEGIVPKPRMADSDLFLKGNGTWSGAVSDISGALACEYAPLPKEVSFGVGLCDADGNWLCPTMQCLVNIRRNELKEGEVELNIPFDDICGASLCSPWSESIPMSLGDNINEWVADKTIWSESKSKKFCSTFSNECTVEVWLERGQSDSTTLLKYCGYGPDCTTTRSIIVQIDGEESIRQVEVSASQDASFSIPEGSVVKVWPEYGKNCIRNEEVSTGNSDAIDWITLQEEPSFINGLDLNISINEGLAHLNVPEIDNQIWPQSLGLLNLTFDYGLGVEQIDMSCMSNWLNDRLEAHDKSILDLEHGLLKVSRIFSGATATSDGNPGLVPHANVDDREKVLMGDGTWGEIYTKPFSGASDGNGEAGIVPAPASGDADKYLRGDGTWASPTARFDSVSEIALNRIPGEPRRTGEVDLSDSSVVQDINALLASNPSEAIYVGLDGTASSTMPEGASFALRLEEHDGVQAIHIQEIMDGEAISESVVQVGEGTSLRSLVGTSNEIAISIEKNPVDGAISISAVNIYGIERDSVVSGFKIGFTNTITGDASSKTLDLLYQGATSSKNGTSGLVPAASISEKDWFLRGDGSWQRIGLYQGATDSSSGVEGLVPPAAPSERTSFLAGDGTWKEVEAVIAPYQGATADHDGFPGLVPAATSLQREMFFCGDGVWRSIEAYQGATTSAAGIPGLVPSALPAQQGQYLAGDGTWKEVPLYQGATDEGSGIPGLVPSALPAQQGFYLAGDGTWKQIVEYQGASESADGISGMVPAATSEERSLYLAGNGTWASPVQEFNAISGISPIETKTQKVRGAEYDLAAALEQANAFLQEDSSREVYISIPDMSVGLEMLEGNGLAFHVVDADGQPGIEIARIADGEVVSSTTQMISDLQNDGENGLLFSWNDEGVEVEASLAFDENGATLTVNSLHAWDLSWISTISGISIGTTNTVTGEKGSNTISLAFIGATDSTAGRAGLAPQPMAGDQGKYLRGDGTWAELVLPNTYQGATENAAGVVGLVPAASSGERDKFLRGDGTWASAKIEGSCVCSYVNVKKQWTLGVNICDGDGSWLASAVQVPASIRPNEILTYTLNLRFGADGPGGCAIWNPYNATQPTSAEERTYEFYRDATIWGRDASSHFIQTFSDGITMNCWIEVDETQTGYHNLKIAVYGPKATSVPRLIPLNVDGTNMFLTETLAAGESKDIAVEGTEIKIYPRPTHRTVLWRNEISEWSGNASSEPVLVEETEAEFPYLSYKVQRTETGIRISADDYSLADWPVELSAATLELSAGGEQTTIDLGCIPAWVSNELQKIDEAIEQAATAINRIGLYKGATENENGVAGLVPPALSAERNGTLHGDGTWGSDIVVTNSMPTSSDVGSLFFYIEEN